MRYYDLDKGKVKASYAVPQPEKEVILLSSAPDDESMWDGLKWVPDPDRLAIKAAEDKKLADIVAAKEAIQTIAEAVDKATTIAGLKVQVADLIRQIKILMG